MSRFLLHIALLIVAALGFCLSAQQLQHANDTAACRKLDPPPPPPQPQHYTAHNLTYSERPESVLDAPSSSTTTTTTTTMTMPRTSNDGVSSRGDRLTDDSQARPTRVKTPAAETVLPTNTKVPVALSAAAATKSSDPGFVALVAALGLVTLGMALV